MPNFCAATNLTSHTSSTASGTARSWPNRKRHAAMRSIVFWDDYSSFLRRKCRRNWSASRCFKMFQDVSRCFKMFQVSSAKCATKAPSLRIQDATETLQAIVDRDEVLPRKWPWMSWYSVRRAMPRNAVQRCFAGTAGKLESLRTFEDWTRSPSLLPCQSQPNLSKIGCCVCCYLELQSTACLLQWRPPHWIDGITASTKVLPAMFRERWERSVEQLE